MVERTKHFRYSVETPTDCTYSFTGKSEESAQTDLTLWDSKGKEKLYNVEFKANNPEQASIDKDIEKLVCEKPKGVWFHLFQNSDRGTFRSLGKKFTEALLRKEAKARTEEILFVICVMEKGIAMEGRLPVSVTDDFLGGFFEEGADLLAVPRKGQSSNWRIIVR